MQVDSYKGGSRGRVEVDETPFGGKVLYRTLKDAVVMHLANQRQGTVNTRGRDQVAGSNKKPWRQKHTGRARAGDRKSPIWRGGGTVFGPKPRSYYYQMPAKARRVALRSALAGKLADGEVAIADLSSFSSPSAKAARSLLAAFGAPKRAVIVLVQRDENVWKSFRNFPGLAVRTADELCTHDVVAGGLIVLQPGALEALARRVGIRSEGSEKGGEA